MADNEKNFNEELDEEALERVAGGKIIVILNDTQLWQNMYNNLFI